MSDAPQMPSVGRIVHYRSRGSADGIFKPECRAAIVTEVNTVFNVGLAVVNPNGMFFDHDVTNESHDEYIPGGWHWPADCHIPEHLNKE